MTYEINFFISFFFVFGFSNIMLYYLIYFINENKEELIGINTTESEEEADNSLKEKKQIPYEEKYIIEFRNRRKQQDRNLKNPNENKENNVNKENKDRNLKNSFLLEKSPLGNVAMYYNQDRECFEYYSDNTIPYRYLETIGRKYVLTYDCLELFIDMEEELRVQKEKMEMENKIYQ